MFFIFATARIWRQRANVYDIACVHGYVCEFRYWIKSDFEFAENEPKKRPERIRIHCKHSVLHSCSIVNDCINFYFCSLPPPPNSQYPLALLHSTRPHTHTRCTPTFLAMIIFATCFCGARCVVGRTAVWLQRSLLTRHSHQKPYRITVVVYIIAHSALAAQPFG